jgi:hypothetical protein
MNSAQASPEIETRFPRLSGTSVRAIIEFSLFVTRWCNVPRRAPEMTTELGLVFCLVVEYRRIHLGSSSFELFLWAVGNDWRRRNPMCQARLQLYPSTWEGDSAMRLSGCGIWRSLWSFFFWAGYASTINWGGFQCQGNYIQVLQWSRMQSGKLRLGGPSWCLRISAWKVFLNDFGCGNFDSLK